MPAIRPAHYRTLAGVFEEDGFTFNRRRGDHLVYTEPGVIRPLVIPA
ncbi:MAG: type II toxin-antitoxin system HicA family toxin [Terracidiphilus sp.]